MKRYFDFSSDRTVCVLDIIDGSQLATSDIENIKRVFKMPDAKEITKSQYKRLQIQYGK